jgi:hypothetical protein
LIPGVVRPNPMKYRNNTRKMVQVTEGGGNEPGETRRCWLGQVQAPVVHFVLQAGGELVNVGRGDVAYHAILKERYAVTANGIAADL